MKEGWLEKRGGVNTDFKSRWHVLNPNGRTIAYYKSQQGSKQGEIDLNSASAVRISSANTAIIEIVTEKRTWILKGRTAGEAEEWRKAIYLAWKRGTAPGVPAPPSLLSSTTNSVTVQFAPPSNTGNLELLAFSLQFESNPTSFTSGSKSVQILMVPSSSSLTYTLSNLGPSTAIHFRVAAENMAGKSEYSMISPAFSTLAAPGAAVTRAASIVQQKSVAGSSSSASSSRAASAAQRAAERAAERDAKKAAKDQAKADKQKAKELRRGFDSSAFADFPSEASGIDLSGLKLDIKSAKEVTSSIKEKADKKQLSDPATLLPFLFQIGIRSTDAFMRMHISSAIASIADIDSSLLLNHVDMLKEMLSNNEEEEDQATYKMAVGVVRRLTSNADNNEDVCKKLLPVVAANLATSSEEDPAMEGFVLTLVTRNPKLGVDCVEELCEAATKHASLCMPLAAVYPLSPDMIEDRLDQYAAAYSTASPIDKTKILSLFSSIAKRRPQLVIPFLDTFKGFLKSASASAISLVTILSEVSNAYASPVVPFVNDLKRLFIENAQIFSAAVPSILAAIARNGTQTVEIVDWLISNTSNAMVPAASYASIMAALLSIANKRKAAVLPHLSTIKTFQDSSSVSDAVRSTAKQLVDFLEGRTLDALAKQVEDQNAKIKDACQDFDALKLYVDKNIDQLKEHLADVVKKLPIPMNFTVEGRIRKTLKLHFTCGAHCSGKCIYPDIDHTFTTETQVFNKWLKVGFHAVKLGVAVFQQDPAGGLEAVMNCYEALKSEYDEGFNTYISEPFLTSEEQDALIVQLRESNFFTVFSYSAKEMNWVCCQCSANASNSSAASASSSAFSAPAAASSPSATPAASVAAAPSSSVASPIGGAKTAIRQGILAKKGATRGKWVDRMVKLTADKIITYEIGREKDAQNISFSEIASVKSQDPRVVGHQGGFVMITKKRAVEWRALSPEEADEWVEAITKAMTANA